MQDREFQEFRTTRVTGGGYKGIPNGLKQSRPGKATPNWTLVSRPPFLENMMRAGGVFVLLYYCEYRIISYKRRGVYSEQI